MGIVAKPMRRERVSLASFVARYERQFGHFTVRSFWNEDEGGWWYGVVGNGAWSIWPTPTEAIIEAMKQIAPDMDALFPDWEAAAWA